MTDSLQPYSPVSRGPTWFWWALIAITILAGALRLYKLDQPSFWVDELYTVKWSLAVTDGVLQDRPLAYAPHTLGYWLAGIDVGNVNYEDYYIDDVKYEDYASWKSAGITERVARMPTMVTGVLSVFVLGWLSRRMIGWQAALILALLLALSTWHLWGSQTARFYAQQLLFYSISFILYYDATRRDARGTMLLAALFLVFAFWTQLTSLMLVAVFGVDWLAGQVRRKPVRWGWWGWLCLVGAALFCLWYHKQQSGGIGGHISGFSGSGQSGWGQFLYLPFMVGLPAAAFALLTLWWLWRQDSRLTILLLANMFIPLITFATFEELFDIDVHVRYLIVSLYGWLAAVAVGLWKLFEYLRPRAGFVFAWSPLALVVVVMSFNTLIYFMGANGFHARWREAFDYVREHKKPDEKIVGDFIPQRVGHYYLEVPHEDILGNTETMEGEGYAKLTDGEPMWIVVRGVSPTAGQRFPWVHEHADLRAYYATQTFQPYASIHVYYYDPSWESNEPRKPD